MRRLLMGSNEEYQIFPLIQIQVFHYHQHAAGKRLLENSNKRNTITCEKRAFPFVLLTFAFVLVSLPFALCPLPFVLFPVAHTRRCDGAIRNRQPEENERWARAASNTFDITSLLNSLRSSILIKRGVCNTSVRSLTLCFCFQNE